MTENRPWLAEYPPGVPADIDPAEFASMADFFAQVVTRYGPRVAYRQFGADLTYSELDDASARLAAHLQQTLHPGDRVALMMPNVIQYPIAIFAALRAGLVIVNVNPLYTAPELVNLIADAAPRAIIVLDIFAATLERALQSTSIETVIVAGIGDMRDLADRPVNGPPPGWNISGAVKFRDVLLAQPAAAFRPPELDHGSIAFLQYTGGTTGKPKGAVLTHGNILAEIQCYSAWWTPVFRPGAETVLIALPLYHVAALVCQSFTCVRYGGTAVLVMNPRDIPALVNDFSTHKPTIFGGLNTLFTALLNNPDFCNLDFSALRMTGAGATATQAAVAERWQALTGRPVIEIYGLSETAGAAIANPATSTHFSGGIGVPLPSITVEIRDAAGREVPYGEPGEICISGPIVMQGYYNQPAETAAVLGPDGFFATGDIGVMSPEGKIRIVDRKKDMVLVSGFNVYPNEVEAVLFRHPGILEVAVIGVADAHSGEIPVACVVRKDPALTESDIIAYARESLTAYKVPRRVVFIEELPKTPVGKVLRRQLRDNLVV
jgi:long-chain acyl-CoA synthetase